MTLIDSRKLHIGLAGPPGSGKTSLAHVLSQHIDARLALEQNFQVPFSSRVLTDPLKFDLASQVSFTLERYYQYQISIPEWLLTKHVVSDYIFETSLVFARMGLSVDDQSAFLPVFFRLQQLCTKPHIVLYLRTSTDILLTRLQTRGESSSWSVEKLRSLEAGYAEILSEAYGTKILEINTDTFNLQAITPLINLIQQITNISLFDNLE